MRTEFRRPLVALLVALIAASVLAPTTAALLPGAPALPPVTPPAPGGLLLRGTVVTMDDLRTVIPDGYVLVQGERIAAVGAGAGPAGLDLATVRVVDLGPDAAIYPGLINLHAHPAYHVLPTWLPPSSHARPADGRPTGLEPYTNRYQWNSDDELWEERRLIEAPKGVLASGLRLEPQMLKWAETMSMLGGQTTYQGIVGRYPATDFTLVRNVDWGAFCAYSVPLDCPDPVASRVSDVHGIEFLNLTTHGGTWLPLADGTNTTWLVHAAEGVRDGERPEGDLYSSRAEFDHLLSLGLIVEETAIIHGNALEMRDFLAMRAAPNLGIGGVVDGRGARLVWSPLSNLLLYGRTTHVYDALEAGVIVNLGTDWTPSGTRNLLGELKVADIALRDPRVLGAERPPLLTDAALDRWLVEMVTRNPAITLDEFARFGSVEAGKLADLVVVTKPDRSPTNGMPDSPYRRLIDATERDVRLVLIGGNAVAGDVDVMTALKPGDVEVVVSERGGYAKAVDVTTPGVPGANETLAEVEAKLVAALTALGGDAPTPGGGPAAPTNTWSWLRLRLNNGAFANMTDEAFRVEVGKRFGVLPDGRINAEAIELNPLLMEDDAFLFDVLAATLDAEDPARPYGAYPANANHVQPGGNPYAPAAFELRWYA